MFWIVSTVSALNWLSSSLFNVAILNPETNKADRVGIKLVENEGKIKRVRFFKSNGSVIGA